MSQRLSIRDLNPLFSIVLYRVGQAITRTICRVMGRWEIRGLENIPADGPVIFASNHRALLDPPLIGSTFQDPPLFYFAKEELFSIPLVGWYIRRVNAFPVRRAEGDVGALKTAMRVLHGGQRLLVFPEGGRRLDPKRQFKARAGVGMIAAKTQVPVVPVGLVNSNQVLRFGKIRVAFGVPIPPPPDDGSVSYQKYADDVMVRIQELCQ